MSNKLRFELRPLSIWIDTMARRPRKPRGPRKPRQPKERKLAGTGAIVTNFRQASRSGLKGATLHQTKRDPDGWSAIDPNRAHLNEVWIGSGMHILNDVNAYLKDVDVPNHKNTSGSPFCTIILGASPEYFRPNGEEPGDEDPALLEAWKAATKKWIRDTFGDDVVSAIYNGDETTPHVHLAICPTYMKMPRKPDGRRKNGETEDDYALRVQEWKESKGMKTLSWSSNAVLGQYNSFGVLRESYAEAMKPLGLEYSLASFEPDSFPDPKQKKDHLIELEELEAEELVALEEERELIVAEREALRVSQEEVLRASKDGHEGVLRIAEKLVADAKEAATRIKATAKAEALERTQQQTDEWESRLEVLTQREKQVERDRKRLKEQMSWISLAVANIGQAFDAAIAGTFTSPVGRDAFPASAGADALFTRRGDKVDEGDGFEFLATHYADGDPIPLPAKLKSVIKKAFADIREFAVNFWDQQKEHRTLQQKNRDLKTARDIANERLTPLVQKLHAARKDLGDARREEKIAIEQNAKLSAEADLYSEALERLRPAYDSLQDWLKQLKTIEPNEQDKSEAEKWLSGGRPKGLILDHYPWRLTSGLQDEVYRKQLCAEVSTQGLECDLSSPDIRDRWDKIKALSDDELEALKAISHRLAASTSQPEPSKKELLEALSLEIAKARHAKTNRMSALARQFLETPPKLQDALERVFDGETPSADLPSM